MTWHFGVNRGWEWVQSQQVLPVYSLCLWNK
jgi:hypothetical protein